MTLRDIRTIVRGGEDQFVEFKKKVAHPEKIIREVVAFANTSGGMLFIGVDDDKQVTGVKFPEEDHYVMQKALEELCRPMVTYETEFVSLRENRTVICYKIAESSRKPHTVVEASGQKGGKVYVRVKDQSLQASREMREILRRRRTQKNVKFYYGEKEKRLMQYLSDHKFITLKKFAEEARVRPYIASRTLVLLVLANVLEIIPQERGEDQYISKF